MSFNENAPLDTSQVEDRRGRGGTALAVGGGGIGLVFLIVAMLLGVDPSGLINTAPQATAPANTTTLEEECQRGADANVRADCRIVGFVNSIQTYWTAEFASRGESYTPAKLIIFSGSTDAACGYASSAMGPFYCPADQQVYIDLTFFDELQTRFGAQGGALAEGYIVAHEYGHHIQDLSGTLDAAAGSNDTGPDSAAVQIELQADCFAGVWMRNATETGYLKEVTDEQIAQSLDAAAAVGDDRIQQQAQGRVSPESWTHGSSEQRQMAVKDGVQAGDPDTCSTPGW